MASTGPIQRVVIGADHGGFELKQVLVTYLKSRNFGVLDVGTHDTASVCGRLVLYLVISMLMKIGGLP